MSSRAIARALVIGCALLAIGCVAPVGASSLGVPKDGASQCESQCAVMGLRLSAVAIMANNVGCVCQPAGPTQGQGTNAVGPAGMATLMMIEQQRQSQVQAQQSSSRR